MSIRSDKNQQTVDGMLAAALDGANLHDPLGEGNSYSTTNQENPLHRDICVSIKASLDDLCLQKGKGKWEPSQEALRHMFQQRQFTGLDGSSEANGDLKSVVLHKLEIKSSKSSFPISVGTRVSSVDDNTFTSTGECFSTVLLPSSENANPRTLQADDTSLAYEFSKKFPGYTSENLPEKGIHRVDQRRFVLVAADHPIVSAISENADKLQMGEISMMPEGLVKISQTLYESILPLVKTQVASQIKVRDFSKMGVTIQPAEYSSWQEARTALILAGKKPLKAKMHAEISACADDAQADKIREEYNKKMTGVEHDVDHSTYEMHMQLGCDYNFLSK
jgi:hypothetical protein